MKKLSKAEKKATKYCRRESMRHILTLKEQPFNKKHSL